MRNVITVDGLAGSGKTTLARLLSLKLSYIHLNSGLLYRGLGWLGLNARLAQTASESDYLNLLSNHMLSLVVDPQGASRLKIDEKLCGEELFETTVSDAASRIAPFEGVRTQLLNVQREAFPGHAIVAEGRDMGTVVFPEARLKFFIVAAVETRASRRLAQILAQHTDINQDHRLEIEQSLKLEIVERDQRDCARAISPTVPAPDAITIDNSSKILTEMVQSMYDLAAERGLS